jgi:hypothetical protein
MALPTWYWPTSSGATRSVVAALDAPAIAAMGWYDSQALIVSSGSALQVFLPATGYTTYNLGFVAGYSGGTAARFIGYQGANWLVSGSVPSYTGLWPLSGSALYAGAAYTTSYYFLRNDGAVYNSTKTLVGNFNTYANGFKADGANNFYTLLPNSNMYATMTSGFVIASAAISGMTTPAVFAIIGTTALGIGGWTPVAPLSGASVFGVDPTAATIMLGVGYGHAAIWTSTTGATDAWSQTTALTGLPGDLSGVAWTPNGVQALCTSPSSGLVDVLGYSGGVLSLAQALPVSGSPTRACVTPDGGYALVPCTSLNAVVPLTVSGGVWSVSGAVVSGIPGAAAALTLGTGSAVIAGSSGLTFLTQGGGGAWSITATGSVLNTAPYLLAVDPFGLIYAAGAAGFVVCSGTTVLSSAGLPATPTSMTVTQGRVVFVFSSSTSMAVFGQTSALNWSQLYAITGLASGTAPGVGVAGTTLFMGSSGGTLLYCFSGSPYQPQRVQTGVFSRLNVTTSGWTTTQLGVGHLPSAIAYDTSNQFRVATSDNMFWTFNSSGTLVSSGVINTYAGQVSGTPLGISSLVTSGLSVYAATSMAGTFGQVA